MRYSSGMTCARCGAEVATTAGPWCVDCERLYDTWIRRHATDIIWQAFLGAGIAMVVGLGGPLIGLGPLCGIIGVLCGAATSLGVRQWSKGRRRRQYLATSLPRAYLPERT